MQELARKQIAVYLTTFLPLAFGFSDSRVRGAGARGAGYVDPGSHRLSALPVFSSFPLDRGFLFSASDFPLAIRFSARADCFDRGLCDTGNNVPIIAIFLRRLNPIFDPRFCPFF